MTDQTLHARPNLQPAARRESTSSPAWKRWLSLQAYGLVTKTLFGANTPPGTLRARFERFSRSGRESLQPKYPGLTFEDHAAGSLKIESIKAAAAREVAVRPVLFHLHGGAFVFGSLDSYRNRAMRLSYRLRGRGISARVSSRARASVSGGARGRGGSLSICACAASACADYRER